MSAALPAEAGPSGVDHDQEAKPHPTLTPPATSGSSKADDDSDSELSDVEMDDEPSEILEGGETPTVKKDLSDIEPEYYYADGKIPVFCPTMEEFEHFDDFIPRIMKHGMKSGIVKVVPPREWKQSLQDLSEAVKTIKVKNPITQEFHGQHGKFTQANIEKQRSYNIVEWKELCEESNHQPPARRGQRRRNQGAPARPAATRSRATPLPVSEGQKRPVGRPRVRPLRSHKVDNDTEDATTDAPPTPVSPKPKHAKTKGETDTGDERPSSTSKAKGKKEKSEDTEKSVTARRKYNRREVNGAIDEAAFKGFDYRLDDLEEFSAERCQELEIAYWKSLNFNNPMYGADMPGSLFDDSVTSWNVAHLPNVLDLLGKEVPGVNTTYLYLGMWKATFSWHLEDVDLFSINYIHFGAPKQWYSISQADARKFEAAMKSVWPEQAKACDQFLRHKTFLISPSVLKTQYGINVNRMVHYEGEFVITFPYGYHSGFNLGYNCAESVNFGMPEWIQYGKIAKKCNCEADSVSVDVWEIERKMNGEPTPPPEEYESYDELDDENEGDEDAGPLTPPGSAIVKLAKLKKRLAKESATAPPKKRMKFNVKPPAEPPCQLCPNNYKFERLINSDVPGKKVHKRCAQYMAETMISNDNGVETALFLNFIDRARWGLKCSYCHVKSGTCFQCSDKKCTVAYHATCAFAAGVQVEAFREPRRYEGDDTEYWLPGYDFRCHKHRAKRSKMDTEEVLEKMFNPRPAKDDESKEIDTFASDGRKMIKKPSISSSAEKNMFKTLEQYDLVQFQMVGGKITAGVVVEHLRCEEKLVLDIMPSGPQMEVDYKYLLYLAQGDIKYDAASDDAVPLPTSKILDLQAPTGVPNHGDIFLQTNGALIKENDGKLKWEEFELGKFDKDQQMEFLLDPKKAPQWWYYLGRTSTEAKAQYTEDPVNKPFHNTKSSFLESVAEKEKKQAPIAITPLRRSNPATFPIVYPKPNMAALNAAQGKARQLAQAKSQNRKDKEYEYKPKIPVEVDPRALAQPRTFQTQPSMAGPYQNSTYQSQFSPTALHPGQGPWFQPGGSHDPRTQPQAWGTNTHHHSTPSGSFTRASPGNASPRQSGPTKQQSLPPATHRRLLPATSINHLQHQPPSLRVQGPQYGQQHPLSNARAARPRVKQTVDLPIDSLALNTRDLDNETAQRLKKYPYLYESYKSMPSVYRSPYKSEGGFADEYLPNKEMEKPKPEIVSLSASYLHRQSLDQQQLIKSRLPHYFPGQALQPLVQASVATGSMNYNPFQAIPSKASKSQQFHPQASPSIDPGLSDVQHLDHLGGPFENADLMDYTIPSLSQENHSGYFTNSDATLAHQQQYPATQYLSDPGRMLHEQPSQANIDFAQSSLDGFAEIDPRLQQPWH